MSTEAFSATLRPAQPFCYCWPCQPCVFLCIISRSSRITVLRITPVLFKLGRFQKIERPVDEPMDSQETFASLQPSFCKGDTVGGFSLLVTVSALASLGWGMLKFIFVLCIYLSQGVFHFTLGKSSYNLMLKKIS